MNKVFFFIMAFIWICTSATGQRNIKTDHAILSIHELMATDQKISYLDPPLPEESLPVRLYKSYFNPGSFTSYREFFLSKDWGGFTENDFNAWQSYLNENKMTLNKTIQLQDDHGGNYIICHYTVETKEYVLPGTAIFKKVNQAWKHISFMNDSLAMDLKQIGLLKYSAIEEMPEDARPRALRSMMSNTEEPVEKFDRMKLFSDVQGILHSKEVSASDIALAEKLFLEKAEVEMVQYIGQAYQIDPYDLMEELNTAIGFRFFKFVRTLKTK